MQNWQITDRAASAPVVIISNVAPNFCFHHSDNFSASRAATGTPLSAAGNSQRRQSRCDPDIFVSDNNKQKTQNLRAEQRYCDCEPRIYFTHARIGAGGNIVDADIHLAA